VEDFMDFGEDIRNNIEKSGAIKIIKMLECAGHSAYIAGKSVRDFIMKNDNEDIYIVTSAGLRELRFLFPSAVDCGNYVIIKDNKHCFYMRKYKSDGEERNINTDLIRRDFTINSMAYNGKLIDVRGGMDDIEKGIIRSIKPPEECFKENPIRIIRAVRYACVFGFEIEEKTKQAMSEYAYLLKNVNQNKLRDELNKMLLSNNPEKMMLLHKYGILKYIMSELDICFDTPQKNKYHIYNVGEHIMVTVKNTPKDLLLRWAALMHDIGKPQCLSKDGSGVIHFYGHHKHSAEIASNILYRLRFESGFIDDLCVLVENHDVRIEPSMPSVKHMMARTGSELFEKLLILQQADTSAKNPIYSAEKTERTEQVRDLYKRVIAENQPYLISHLLITRKDLLKLGVKTGRDITNILRELLDEVIISPKLNNREYLIKRARQLNYKEKG